MTQVFNQDVHITNTTSNNGLTVVQNGNAKGVYVDQNGNAWGLHINHSTVGKYGLYVETGGHGVGIKATGSGAGLVFLKTSTDSSNCCYVSNAGTGKGFYITQNGEGVPCHLNKNSTGSTEVLRIDNDGSGADIRGHGSNWQIDPDGDATFANVDCDCGMVTAKNTAIAGGRVHLYDRGQGVTYETCCDWGLSSTTPVQYGVPSQYFSGVVRLLFDQEVNCPVVKVQPWVPGYYEEDMECEGWIYGPTAPPIQGFMTLECNIEKPVYGTMPGCWAGVDLMFSYCLWGEPGLAAQGEYIVQSIDPPNYYNDIVFDFEVLGCPCEILL